jgi:2-oxoglutarate ferredoxin oxidoreductase subunit alpha
VRFTGSSHDEHGFLTKDPTIVGRLNEHLWRKIEDHASEVEIARPDLQDDSRTLLVAYGITARAMTEAVRTWRTGGGRVSALAVQTLWPVPERALLRALQDRASPVERIVLAELNLGDFRREVERVVYRWAAVNRMPPPEILGLNRIDGELIAPAQFLDVIC